MRGPAIILDVLSVLDPLPLPVRELVRITTLCGVSSNATRVALSRLVAAGKVEHVPGETSPAYRFTEPTRALNRYVRAALDAPAVRPWTGEWWQILPRGRARTGDPRAPRLTALEVFHFAQLRRGLWIRPANLSFTDAQLQERLADLDGRSAGALLVCRFVNRRRERALARRLWPLPQQAKACRQALRRLERSLAALPALSLEAALQESFVVGGEVIRLLFRDPLLPTELLPASWPAGELRALFHRYCAKGYERWAEFVGTVPGDRTALRTLLLGAAAQSRAAAQFLGGEDALGTLQRPLPA
ncbi:MAG: hypothetical protein IT371_11955 [Deltaproteobacteria bacterium]|nr:hypothetical protein [Deltaproteobacteria bacterium]